MHGTVMIMSGWMMRRKVSFRGHQSVTRITARVVPVDGMLKCAKTEIFK